MRLRIPAWATAVVCVLAATAAHAATIAVPAGGDLQAALDAAQPGDVITLEPNATYTGNLKSVRWRLDSNGWLRMDYTYNLTGTYDFLGVNFDYPESKVTGVTWLGRGP